MFLPPTAPLLQTKKKKRCCFQKSFHSKGGRFNEQILSIWLSEKLS